MNDIEDILIKKSKKGDIDAFEELIGNYQKKSYNIALKMLKNPEDAMDVSQEALIKVYKSIKKFENKSSFSTWMYRIVVNTCLDFIKKDKKNLLYLDKPIETEEGNIKMEVIDDYNTPENLLEKKLTKKLVKDSINMLKDEYKSIIILRDMEGFSYEEISKILEIPIGTVKSRIKRARDNLKIIIINSEQYFENLV